MPITLKEKVSYYDGRFKTTEFKITIEDYHGTIIEQMNISESDLSELYSLIEQRLNRQ
jgi:hypothetical protein